MNIIISCIDCINVIPNQSWTPSQHKAYNKIVSRSIIPWLKPCSKHAQQLTYPLRKNPISLVGLINFEKLYNIDIGDIPISIRSLFKDDLIKLNASQICKLCFTVNAFHMVYLINMNQLNGIKLVNIILSDTNKLQQCMQFFAYEIKEFIQICDALQVTHGISVEDIIDSAAINDINIGDPFHSLQYQKANSIFGIMGGDYGKDKGLFYSVVLTKKFKTD